MGTVFTSDIAESFFGFLQPYLAGYEHLTDLVWVVVFCAPYY